MSDASKDFTETLSGGNLYWPSNIQHQYDYMEMEILRFSQRNILKRDKWLRGDKKSEPVPTSWGPDDEMNITPETSREASTTKLIPKGKILLPIPDNVSYTDGPQWSDQSVNALGKFGAQVVADMVSGQHEEAAGSLAQAASVGQTMIVKGILSKLGVDPNAVAQNIGGKIANPYLQQIFQGVGMRHFDFNWKLVPRNEKEQKSITKIIKTLRSNILPGFSDDFSEDTAFGNAIQPDVKYGEDGENSRTQVDKWLTVPNIFNLKWKCRGTEIKSLPKLKQCVCKNISVQYTPDGVWASHMMGGSPQPIAYNLTMSFGEMSIVTNSDVVAGF